MNKAIELDDENTDYYLVNRANVLFDLKKYFHALVDFKKAYIINNKQLNDKNLIIYCLKKISNK